MNDKKETTVITERKATPSERFTMAVQRQFVGEVGSVHFTDYEKTLAQHIFIKVDSMMIEMNAKSNQSVLINWENVNMRKLAIDAVNRVRLGVDALIPGHLYPIAYLNGKTKQFDVDLRVGYRGEMYYKSKASAKPIRDVRVELVYDTDEFIVYKRGANCAIEGYDFKVTEPFARGDVVGGFGYIEFEDGRDNILVTLSKAEIDKFRQKAMSDKFWGPWYEQMAYKTIVHRVMDKIIIDPEKINVTALASLESEENVQPGEAPVMLGNTPMALELEEDKPVAIPQPEQAITTDGPQPQKATEEDPF